MLIYNKSPELIKKGVDVVKSKLGTNVNPINNGLSETSTVPSPSTALSPDEDWA